MKTQILKLAIALATTFLAQPSGASIISYELQSLGTNNYRYVYTVNNDGTLPGGAAIQLFDILFDPALYDESSLTIANTPTLSTEWAQQILASAPGVPAAYDVFANGTGVANGASANGFAVNFLWIGAGLPGAQSIEIYDPVTFELLETGITEIAATVPVPGAFVLMLSGVSFLSVLFRRKAAL